MLIDSERAMLKLGADFAKQLRAPALIELLGDLGAGKTTFTRGLAQGLGVTDLVSSPSFTISRNYQGEKYRLAHYDFYRLADPGIMAEDLRESINDPDTITVIEWGASVQDFLPKHHYTVSISYQDEKTREVTIR
ncbi:tRNA (adenosine(37)-N6)-threonylcarbamoyltransferase complex ATPase subunit type 1 TsaE [Candidatus Saccharibacteria bacterium]|nr:tRNA (adenosine(37)-N6)-threonylcarbamoyltransferase complex ATPase subunit type 1 TsaE [Candidatus Saccharibacteria bacterium]